MNTVTSGMMLIILLTSMTTLICDIQSAKTMTANICDWTMIGYDANCTSFSPSSAPDTNATSWVSALPGGTAWAYPIVGDGKVFIGAGGLLNAFNESTGALLWSYNAPGQPGYPDCAAFGNGIVYFGTGEPGPSGCVYGLNATTAAEIWECPTDGYVRDPIVAANRLYFGVDVSGTDTGKVYCVDANTGALIWTYTTQDYGVEVAVAYDKVYASCGHWISSTRAAVYCLGTDGSYIWSFPTTRDIAGGLSVANGRVYFACSEEDSNCVIFALNATNGNEIWQNVDHSVSNAARTAAAYGKLFVGLGGSSRGIYALNETNGNMIWIFPISTGGEHDRNNPIGGPVVAEHKVFFAVGYPSHTFYAVDEATGAVVWSFELVGGVHSRTSAIANGRVFVGDHYDGKLYAFGQVHDVAITDVTPSGTVVAKGYPASINVTIANQGDFTEALNVTAYANTTQIGKKTVTNLDPDANQVLSFAWDTTSLEIGNYRISANATQVPGETLTINNAYMDGIVEVREPTHDVAVIDVTPSKSTVGQGYIVSINVTVENQSPIYQDTAYVTVYANTIEILTKTATNLDPLANKVLTFEWDTKEIPLGIFIIEAVADPVPGEEDIIDNTLIDGTVIVQPTVHDIAVTGVKPSDIFTGPGSSLEICVTIENQGNMMETFNVTVFANETMIQTKTIVNMNFETSQKSYFTWNTMGFALGNYTITATASIVPGEVHTSDNTYADGTVSIITGTLLYVYPHATSFLPGETFTIDVRVINVNHLYMWQVGLYFDPAVLTYISGAHYTDYNWVSDDNGFWPPITGQHTLCQITFMGKEEGISSLHIDETYTTLVNSYFIIIPFYAVDGSVTIRPAIHDIAVTDVALSKTVIGHGYNTTISVKLANQGDYTETFDLTVYANTTLIALQVVALHNGTSQSVTFTWYTEGFAKGRYTISANCTLLEGEIDVLDNSFTLGVVKVTIPGDIDGDFFVNIKDATLVGFYWLQHSPPAPANIDINGDGIINIKDATIVGLNWLKDP